MSALVVASPALPATPPDVVAQIFELEKFSLEHCGQVEIPTDQLLHAGMYVRTIQMAPGVVLTGALMKRSMVVIISGHVRLISGNEVVELDGYNVMPASAGRKQVIRSLSLVHLTMIFPSQAITTEEAEEEFTDQAAELMSRKQNANTVVITGE